MPITEVTAYKDSCGKTYENLLDAQVEEMMRVYFATAVPPTDEDLESHGQNELTRWAAQTVINKLPEIIKALYGPDARITNG